MAHSEYLGSLYIPLLKARLNGTRSTCEPILRTERPYLVLTWPHRRRMFRFEQL